MMEVKKSGRLPLWMQRLRSAEMLDSLVKDTSGGVSHWRRLIR